MRQCVTQQVETRALCALCLYAAVRAEIDLLCTWLAGEVEEAAVTSLVAEADIASAVRDHRSLLISLVTRATHVDIPASSDILSLEINTILLRRPTI